MRKPGQYAPLSAHYADDERIMEAGEDAELLYVRMLAYAARTPMTEGWISDAVLHSRLGITPRVAGNGAGNEPGTDAGSRAERLREVGLIERSDNGWRITSWLKWNRSIEEMGRERTRDARRKKATTSDDDGTDAGSRAGNDAGVPHASPLSDQITDTDHKQRTPALAEVPDRADMNPDAILQSHGMPETDRRAFKAWLLEERKVRSLAPWLTKVQTAGEVPDLILAWRAATKPKKAHPSRDPSSPHHGQEWMFRQ